MRPKGHRAKRGLHSPKESREDPEVTGPGQALRGLCWLASGFFYLSPGSRLPTGPFSTFISALWGMWPFLLSLCTFQSSWEARTIHHLTSELFTYLPSRCCCMNMCHLIMAMNKVSPSMPRGCSSNDNVFELSFFYPKVSHCLLPWGLTSRGIKGMKAFVFDLFTCTVSLFPPAVFWSGRSKL